MEQVAEWRERIRPAGPRLVVTNGCFDILHIGHIRCLQAARSAGDLLLVGVNGDDAVRRLKGAGRPIHCEEDRAAALAALEAVDAVCLFHELSAVRFLTLSRPDVYVKGGDYTLETLHPEERRAVEAGGGRILLVPFFPGHSTSALIRTISQL
jgi:D-glycero-beta-D-manno-heptose 1-phosphate adenylyltransferase